MVSLTDTEDLTATATMVTGREKETGVKVEPTIWMTVLENAIVTMNAMLGLFTMLIGNATITIQNQNGILEKTKTKVFATSKTEEEEEVETWTCKLLILS